MAFSDNYFRQEDPEKVKNTNYFLPDTEGSKVLSNTVFKETVERYAVRSGKSYEEAYKEVVRTGPENIFLSDYTPPTVDILDKAIKENYDFVKLQEEQSKYTDNIKTVLESKDSADLARDLTEEDMFKDPLWKTTIIMDRVRKNFANATPEEGIVGSAFSFIGAVASEMTVGAFNDLLNTIGLNVGREARGEEAYKLLTEAQSLEEVDKIILDLVSYAKQYGYTGSGNPFLMTSELISVLSAGESEYPVVNTALNVLTSGTVWKGVGAIGDAVTAKKASQAIDYVDLNAAVKGTEGGNTATAVALKTEGTTARVSDHAEYDAMRIIKTSPDSAIDVTVKPTDAFEKAKDIEYSLRVKKSFIEDISKRYAGDDVAIQDEITRVVKETLSDYAKITDTAVANVSIEDLEKITAPVATKGKPKKVSPAAYADESFYDKVIRYVIDLSEDEIFSVTKIAKDLGLEKREEVFPFINRMKVEKIVSGTGAKLVNTFEEALKLKKPMEAPVKEAATSAVNVKGEPVFTVEDALLNNRYAVANFVKSDGTLFKNRSDAEKIVSTYGQGEVVETTGGFYIKYRSAISLKDSAPSTKVGSGIKSFYTEREAIRSLGPLLNYFSRGKQTTSRFLQSSYILGMKKSSAILSQYADVLKKSFLKLSSKDQEAIDKVLTHLRDEDSFSRSTFYDELEFAMKFAQLNGGRTATKEIVEGYDDLVRFFNTVNIVQADKALKRVVADKGFYANFRGKGGYVVFRTTKTPEFVYDTDSGKTLKGSELNNRPVYELFDDAGISTDKGYTRFVVGSIENSRPVRHDDVYGFTPGNSRIFDDFSFIGVQDNIVQDISGEMRNARPITAILGKTKNEVDKAVKEVEILRTTYLDKAITDEAFEELVKKHNGFDPAFVSASSVKAGKQAFSEWMEAHQLSMDRPLKVVSRKDSIGKVSTEGDYLYEDSLYKNLNPASGKKARVSFGYGNGSLYKNSTALDTLPRLWSSSQYYLGRRDYEKMAVEGFLKGAKEAGVIVGGPVSNKRNLMDRLLNTEIDTSTIAGRKFAIEQKVLKDRLAVDRENTVVGVYDNFVNFMGEKLTDIAVSDSKLAKAIKNNRYFKSLREYSTSDVNSRDPYSFIRGLTFHPNFGFLNPDSAIIQASGVLNAATRTNPAEAARATSLYMSMRGVLINPTEENIKEVFKRSFAANLVSDEKEFKEIVNYLRDSGWLQIHDNVALGSAQSVRVTKPGLYGQALLNASAFGYREGNILNHIVSTNIAYREFRAIPKNKNLDITKGFGKTEFERFMAYRVEDLSGSMSMASAAPWQKGFPSLAMQYLSQPIRATEDMFIGRLNPNERALFLTQQLALYGASGTVPTAIGASYLLDGLWNKEEKPMDRDLYTTVRWGLLDYTLSNLIGEYTAMSNRLASGTAILDTVKNMYYGKFTEVISGPSGNIYYNWFTSGKDLFESSFNALVVLANTEELQGGLVADDFEKALRKTIRTADIGLRSYYLYQYGEYTRKDGDKIPVNYPSVTAMSNLLGIPLQDQTLFFEAIDLKKNADAYLTSIGDDVERLHKARADAYAEGKFEEYHSYSREIEVLLLPLDKRDKDKIIKTRLRGNDSTSNTLDYIFRNLGSEAARQLDLSIEKSKENK
jgi:hypothetical protein